MASLRAVNLNLLPILRVLLREVSVTRAAGVLGLSPSATSEALGRLRETLDDPLLVQAGRSMRLTPRALALIRPVEQLCDSAELLLRSPGFDPVTSQRSFSVASSDYAVWCLGGPLVAHLSRHAPGLRLSFHDTPLDVVDRLATGEFDFALLARFYLQDAETAQSSVRFTPLYTDRMVAVIAQAHPLASLQPLTREALQAHPALGSEPLPGQMDRHRMLALRGGMDLRYRAVVPHVGMLLPLLRSTVGWTMLPAGLARPALKEGGLVMRELPDPVPEPLEICLAWGLVNDADPGHAWLKAQWVAAAQPGSADGASATPKPACGTSDGAGAEGAA